MLHKEEIANLLLEKFVSEEIMTKSEFQLSIDRIMDRHEAKIDARFQLFADDLREMRSDFKSLENRVEDKLQAFGTEIK